jgi:hypothetical protein
MSVEALILLALFVVLPMIQQLIRATRDRNQSSPQTAERQSPGTLARTPAPELAAPPLPDPTLDAAYDALLASDHVPAPHTGRPVTLAPTPRRTTGQHTAVGLRSRRDLRRAIVVAAILAPCRASSPYHSPEQIERT